MAEKWSLKGTYFESCNCDVACPCVFLSAPTQGDCTLLVGWHIDQGRYADTHLDGLNVGLAVYTPGHMLQTKWKVALYLDERASESQQNALIQIFSGQQGGHFGNIAPLIGEMLGATVCKIDFQQNGKSRSLKIGDVASMEVEAIQGQGGGDVTISGHPLTIVPEFPAVAAKSKHLSYNDYGMSWELSGKNGYYSPFAYKAG
jgi:hypothetical protein